MAPKKGEKEKNQNIQVMVRCRPLNADERKKGGYSVVDLHTDRKEISVKERMVPTANSKTFAFDKVFDGKAKQIDVYKSVCSPLIEEVLTGYNCTVFAYGQTGTGKTYTMEGDRSDDPSISWENDPQAGLIPRAMHQLFARLARQPDCEFSVRVSFLEIYNEELIDLLGAESVENPRLRIYEDASRKGSCVIQGLEEVVVRNKNEVYDIMKRGAARRQTAATLMNAHSSRSHVLFMVTIHTKENSVDGEELLKTGKLNLVDLAGSECIGRSGAVDKRAREAGQINQSLLTLGRVISALVEHAPHIPYRESKLTRLLQDSLGGRTKTSIIATISPASSNLEETLSTLDYAYRAKNIQNKPELNQKLTKKALLKEYNEEIERMRRDLQAARDKNGIFMAQENYDAMHTQIAQQTDTIKELSDQIDSVTAEMEKLNDLFSETKEELIETKGELEQTSKNLKETKGTLKVTQVNLYKTTRDRDEQKHLVGAHVKNETKLYEQASQLKYTSEEATSDVGALQDKLDRKRKVEQTNDTVQETFRKRFRDNIDGMQKNLRDHTELNISKLGDSNSFLESIRKLREEETSHLTSSLTSVISDISQRIDSSVSNFTSQTEGAKESVQKMKELVVKSRDEELCRQFDFQEQTFETGMTTVEGQLNSIKTDLSSLAVSIETMFQAHKVGMYKFVDEQSEYLTKQQQLLDEFMQSQTESHQMEIDHVSTSLESQKTLNQTLADDFLGNVQQWVKDMLTKQHDHLSGNIEKSKAQLTSNKESVDKFHREATTGTKTMRSWAKANLETTHKQYDDDKAETQKSIDAIKTEVGAGMHTKTEIQKSVAVFSEETRRLCTERSDNVCDLIDGHMKVLNEHMETNVTAVQELETTEEKAISTLATKQEADLKSLEGSIVSQTETQDAHGKAVQSWSDNVNKELESRDSEMERFLSDELQKDQPTGKTPQRRDFTYPRTLSKTDRHSTLLTEFRKDYTNDEALNIPVSDDSFASLISQPPPVMELDDEMEEGSEQAADSQDEDIQNSSSDSAFSSTSTVSSVIDNNSKNVSLDKKLSRSTNSLNSHLSKNLSESKENISMKPPSGVPKTRQPSTKSHRTPSKTPSSKNPTPGAKSKTGSTTKSNTPNAAAPKAKTKLPLRSSNP